LQLCLHSWFDNRCFITLLLLIIRILRSSTILSFSDFLVFFIGGLELLILLLQLLLLLFFLWFSILLQSILVLYYPLIRHILLILSLIRSIQHFRSLRLIRFSFWFLFSSVCIIFWFFSWAYYSIILINIAILDKSISTRCIINRIIVILSIKCINVISISSVIRISTWFLTKIAIYQSRFVILLVLLLLLC